MRKTVLRQLKRSEIFPALELKKDVQIEVPYKLINPDCDIPGLWYRFKAASIPYEQILGHIEADDRFVLFVSEDTDG